MNRHTYIIKIPLADTLNGREERYQLGEHIFQEVRDSQFYHVAGSTIDLTISCLEAMLATNLEQAARAAGVDQVGVQLVRCRRDPSIQRIRS